MPLSPDPNKARSQASLSWEKFAPEAPGLYHLTEVEIHPPATHKAIAKRHKKIRIIDSPENTFPKKNEYNQFFAEIQFKNHGNLNVAQALKSWS